MTSNSGKSQSWFSSEIQQMMHGLGDVSRPLLQTATLIEQILQQQMHQLLHQAVEACHLRNSRYMGLEDILFVMRKDKVKLRRLIQYLQLKDLKAAVMKRSEDEDQSDVKPGVTRKRTKICYDFLCTIDQTGELLALFEDNGMDEIKRARALRADTQSLNMDKEQYKRFCDARQASFGRKYKLQKFREWLSTRVNPPMKPNALALEVLSYLSYECIAQIVDLALLVRQDGRSKIDDPVAQVLPNAIASHDDAPFLLLRHSQIQAKTQPLTTSPADGAVKTELSSPDGATGAGNKPQNKIASTQNLSSSTGSSKTNKKQKKTSLVSNSRASSTVNLASLAIQPSDVHEALRRYGPELSAMMTTYKCQPPSVKNILLCC